MLNSHLGKMSKIDCFYNNKIQSDCFYNAFLSPDKCHLPKGADIFLYHSKPVCLLHRMESEPYDILSTKTLTEGFFSIVAPYCVLLGLSVARLFTHQNSASATKRFLIEFIWIVIPIVYLSTSGFRFLVIYVIVVSIGLLLYGWRKGVYQMAPNREFEIGKRPPALTIVRSMTYLGTAVTILAVDFDIFPQCLRKSRRFGASLMDSGIGIFVITMGMVSRRPQRRSDYRRLAVTVTPLLALGLARTLVISVINYNQDVHEYGMHLNAFFTMGFTKLFGTLLSALVRSDAQLLPMSIGILLLHETILQLGVSNYVMDDFVIRDTLFSANREGICSIPGFVALYLGSISIASRLRSNTTLSYSGMLRSLREVTLSSLICWIFFVASAYSIGIARVTCNFGYVAFVLAIIETILAAYMVIFDLILNIALPVSRKATLQSMAENGGDAEILLKISEQTVTDTTLPVAPILSEAISMNGLTFFLITNVLTGLVNICLKPGDRIEWESFAILNAYMALSLSLIYVLYRKKIRIA